VWRWPDDPDDLRGASRRSGWNPHRWATFPALGSKVPTSLLVDAKQKALAAR
jgi:hypothetical protein